MSVYKILYCTYIWFKLELVGISWCTLCYIITHSEVPAPQSNITGCTLTDLLQTWFLHGPTTKGPWFLQLYTYQPTRISTQTPTISPEFSRQTGYPEQDYITHLTTPILKELHWLPVHARINFKILLLVHQSLQSRAPTYIQDLIQHHSPPRLLRSSNTNLLHIPRTHHTWGTRSFSHIGPSLECSTSPHATRSLIHTVKDLPVYFHFL